MLVFVDALMGRGWGLGDAPENHTLGTPEWFGNEVSARRRLYLQCCLRLPQLIDRGLGDLPSGGCEAC
eukprot:8344879-Prorocentrum_lima.AAC.1